MRKKLSKMARQEEIFISELSSDAPERETVVNRIITRSKETITKLTKVSSELTGKRTALVEMSAKGRKDITSLTEKLTSIQAKILTLNENLKLKIAERKSKKEILATYGVSAGERTSTAEGAMVTQAGIDKMTQEITTLREEIKKNIQVKNEYFTTKLTTQKTVDLYVDQMKTIEV
jgi:TolA-binding protein